jgi:agmatinase
MADYTFAFETSTTHAGFLKAPSLAMKPRARFLVAGIPWDGATTNRPGARFGPYQIRRASHMLCDGIHPLFGASPLDQLADAGDLTLPNTSLAAMRAALLPKAQALISQHHMAWLGGDHSITLPLLRAYRAHHGQPLSLLHFDAHCDTWQDHFGEPSGHGTWVYEAVQEGLIDPKRTVQIGIRSSADDATGRYIEHQGGAIFTARDLRGLESAKQLADVLTAIRTRLKVPGQPLYLSLDIDCLDPAFAPGTGTPEPGGLSTNQVLSLLEGLHDLPFVGMDCCEVSPPYDHAELTSNAAATLLWTYLSAQAQSR